MSIFLIRLYIFGGICSDLFTDEWGHQKSLNTTHQIKELKRYIFLRVKKYTKYQGENWEQQRTKRNRGAGGVLVLRRAQEWAREGPVGQGTE